MAKKETKKSKEILSEDKKIKTEKLTVFELNQYQAAAKVICDKYVSFLQANDSIISKSERERMTNLFIRYQGIYDKIIKELEKRLNDID